MDMTDFELDLITQHICCNGKKCFPSLSSLDLRGNGGHWVDGAGVRSDSKVDGGRWVEDITPDAASAACAAILENSNNNIHSLVGVNPGQAILKIARAGLTKTDMIFIAADLEAKCATHTYMRCACYTRYTHLLLVSQFDLADRYIRLPTVPYRSLPFHSSWAESTSAKPAAGKVGMIELRRRNSHSYGDWVPLLFAAREGLTDLCEVLISRKADVNVRDEDKLNAGYTPLLSAAARGDRQTIDLLLNKHADPNIPDRWVTFVTFVTRATSPTGGAPRAPLNGPSSPLL